MARIAPLLILVLAPLMALPFGSGGVSAGILSAGIIFAMFLFPPLHSLQVEASGERTSLILLVTLGIPAAYFVAIRPANRKARHR